MATVRIVEHGTTPKTYTLQNIATGQMVPLGQIGSLRELAQSMEQGEASFAAYLSALPSDATPSVVALFGKEIDTLRFGRISVFSGAPVRDNWQAAGANLRVYLEKNVL